MAESTIPTIKDSDPWVKSTFIVSLGTDYTSYKDIVLAGLQDEAYGTAQSPKVSPELKAMLSTAGSETGPIPVYYSRKKCRDTSLGGNDAINCFYGFNSDDDIAHPFTTSDYGETEMGRVYSEMYDDTQQILYLTFGIPVYNSISGFYSKAIIPELAELMNTGRPVTPGLIGELLGKTITTFLMLPAIPFLFLNRVLGGITTTKITKYYDFSNKMFLYYRCVAGIVAHLAVNLKLGNDEAMFVGSNGAIKGDIRASGSSHTGSTTNDKTHQELQKQVATESGKGLPDIFRLHGFDPYRILAKKACYEDGRTAEDFRSTDEQFLDSLQIPEPVPDSEGLLGWTEDLIRNTRDTLYDAQMYIGFRIDKTLDNSESVSNATGESEVAQTINSKIQGIRNLSFSSMAGNLSDGAIGQTIEGVFSAVGGVLKGAANVAGFGGVTSILTGQGIIDVPEQWMNSSFTKDYSFSIPLKTPYADPVSIMSSLYFPLALLLSGALPRGVGNTSYTSPFLCQAFCKGMFAIPLGIIDSMTIKRGSDLYGWNYAKLPTALDISFTIKDLSPAMFLPLADTSNAAIQAAFGDTSSFQEYLLTLSGIGLAERVMWSQNMRKRAQKFIEIMYQTKLSPYYWGMEIGYTKPARVLSHIMPSTKLPTN